MASGQESYNRLIHRLADVGDLYQQVSTNYYAELHDYGTGELYTSTEVHLVTRIEENPGITGAQIAEATNRTKSAVSQMIAKLETKGLIHREKDPNNGRQYFLYVTEKGNHLSRCHKAYDEIATPMKDLVDRFGMESVENFVDIMEYMIDFYQRRHQK